MGGKLLHILVLSNNLFLLDEMDRLLYARYGQASYLLNVVLDLWMNKVERKFTNRKDAAFRFFQTFLYVAISQASLRYAMGVIMKNKDFIMDQLSFQHACDKIIDSKREGSKIGTLGEKTIHAILKNYLVSDETCHEIKIGSYYADIADENGIIEIQTRNFDKLRKKLEAFLVRSPVTIVYPIPHTKWLRWVNEETGEISPPRKSPKSGTPYMIFPELYKIKNYLLNPNLRLHIILMDLEEYRFLDGWSRDKKKGSTRSDGIPTGLVEEVLIQKLSEYEKLIPEGLPENFTSKDYQKAAGLRLRDAGTALNILHYVGAVKRIGKKGRAYLYSR